MWSQAHATALAQHPVKNHNLFGFDNVKILTNGNGHHKWSELQMLHNNQTPKMYQ